MCKLWAFAASLNYDTRGSCLARASARPVAIDLGNGERVSGLLQAPVNARACYVLAHGAGAGMTHPFLAAVAGGLGERGIATLRYQFPYMERGSKRTDAPELAQTTVRAAVVETSRLAPGLPLIAGGKSFGGRMTSQAQAAAPLPGSAALRFSASRFIRRAARRRARQALVRRAYSDAVPARYPRRFADLKLLRSLVERLGARAALKLLEDADHSFHVPARSGRTDAEIRAEMLDALADWIGKVVQS